MILLFIELIILFIGINLKALKVHVFSILWHFIGTISLIWFTLDNWSY